MVVWLVEREADGDTDCVLLTESVCVGDTLDVAVCEGVEVRVSPPDTVWEGV